MSAQRIVILASSLDVLGGAQRVAHVLANGLAGRGHAVTLVGVAPSPPAHPYEVDPAVHRVTLMDREWPPLPVLLHRSGARLPPDPAVLAERAGLTQQAVDALRPVLAGPDPGIVVCTQLWAMEHLALTPHEGWAVIGQYHSSMEAAAAGGDLARALDLYRDVDAVAMLTPGDADAMRAAGLTNVTWLPNPLAFWPDPPVEDRGGAAGVVGYLGRLSHEKGVAFLVEAWGSIADRFPQWRLRLVGDGPEQEPLRDRVRGLPAGADRVEFAAPVPDPEAALRGFDVLAQPSLTEGLPLALAEAMALGLPCVATDCSSGVRLLSRDGSAARLVARADAGGLAEALAGLMSSPSDRVALGMAARAGVEGFRLDPVLDRWESLFAEVTR